MTNIQIITDSIGSVAEVSEENLASAEAVTQEQTVIMEEITASTQELANFATKLESLMKKFIV